MSERDEAGLRRLKRDLDEADWPAPELLARYATEPNRLSELEKQTVERALAASPLVADELATLRGFDFAKLDADRRPGTESAGIPLADGLASPAGLAGLVRRWLARPPVWAAAAALLALTFWLAQAQRGDAPTAPTADPTNTTPQLVENTPEPAAESGPEPTEIDPSGGARDGSGTQIVAEAAGRPSEAPTESRNPAPTPTPSPRGEAAPDASAAQGEILLAMAMPDYRPAYGVESMAQGEWIVRGGDDAPARITVLAPDHVVRACSPGPILHWSLDRVPGSGDFFLTIVDAQDEPVVLDRRLARPARPGLQRTDLAALGIALPSGGTLRWSIALREDEASPPGTFDFGWLRVEVPDAAAADPSTRGDASRSADYAALGCYAESLEAALRARASHPKDPAPERAVEALARRAGFDPALARE
ncbi:MAG: DUF928 domain-containing protein [Deltaproteobacteria bacterium]|nr:DUF928 domain-containing protein [Deltaproteobacteria bacterium]